MDVCVKILQMLDGSSGFFTSREGGSESEECVLNDGEIESAYALTLDERVKLGHGREAAGDL